MPGRNDWTSGLRRAPAPLVARSTRSNPSGCTSGRRGAAERAAPRPVVWRCEVPHRTRTGLPSGRPGGGLALKCCRSAPTDRGRPTDGSLDRQPTPNTGYLTHDCARPHARPGPLTRLATSPARPGDPEDHPGDHGERRRGVAATTAGSATRTVTTDSGCRSSRSSRAPPPPSPPR